jgi:hypothetical protein
MSDRATSRSRLMEKEVELRDLNHRMNQLVSIQGIKWDSF